MVIIIVVFSQVGGLAVNEVGWLVGDGNAPRRTTRGRPAGGRPLVVRQGFGHDVTRKRDVRATYVSRRKRPIEPIN